MHRQHTHTSRLLTVHGTVRVDVSKDPQH